MKNIEVLFFDKVSDSASDTDSIQVKGWLNDPVISQYFSFGNFRLWHRYDVSLLTYDRHVLIFGIGKPVLSDIINIVGGHKDTPWAARDIKPGVRCKINLEMTRDKRKYVYLPLGIVLSKTRDGAFINSDRSMVISPDCVDMELLDIYPVGTEAIRRSSSNPRQTASGNRRKALGLGLGQIVEDAKKSLQGYDEAIRRAVEGPKVEHTK